MDAMFTLPMEISQEVILDVYQRLGRAIEGYRQLMGELEKLKHRIKILQATDSIMAALKEGKNETARAAILRQQLPDEFNLLADLEEKMHNADTFLQLCRIEQSYIHTVIRMVEVTALNAQSPKL